MSRHFSLNFLLILFKVMLDEEKQKVPSPERTLSAYEPAPARFFDLLGKL
ncbi:hypothetical protein DCCM_0189 [Desulfocucumis palustris]|uniref:Uncharacterized protein n=1 Tax=Desulfocucumis palustris TaxID=1898651 RepID=A0A2L2X7E4_9FIRM|nr:hypothetical protein DCCM_0189 [Desulfocucumis palustris]